MKPQWYVKRNDEEQGPYSLAKLRDAVSKGFLGPNDVVRQEGSNRWVAAGSIPGFTSNGTAPRRPTASKPADPVTAEQEFGETKRFSWRWLLVCAVSVLVVIGGIGFVYRDSQVRQARLQATEADAIDAAIRDAESWLAGKSDNDKAKVSELLRSMQDIRHAKNEPHRGMLAELLTRVEAHDPGGPPIVVENKGEPPADSSDENPLPVAVAPGRNLKEVIEAASKEDGIAATAGRPRAIAPQLTPYLGEARLRDASGVNCYAFDPSGSRLAIGSYKAIHIWDAISGELIAAIHHKDIHPQTLVWSADGKHIAVGAWMELVPGVGFIDVASRSLTRVVPSGLRYSSENPTFSFRGDLLAASENNTLVTWDFPSGRVRHRISIGKNKQAKIKGIRFSADGEFAIALLDDGTIHLVNVSQGRWLKTIGDKTRRYWSISSHATENRLAAYSISGIEIIDLPSGKEIVSHRPPVAQGVPLGWEDNPVAEFIGKTSDVVYVERPNVVRVFRSDTKTDEVVFRSADPAAEIISVLPSSDASLYAYRLGNLKVALFDQKTQRHRFDGGPYHAVDAFVFRNDDANDTPSLLVTRGGSLRDSSRHRRSVTVEKYDIETGRLALDERPSKLQFGGAKFSRQGNILVGRVWNPFAAIDGVVQWRIRGYRVGILDPVFDCEGPSLTDIRCVSDDGALFADHTDPCSIRSTVDGAILCMLKLPAGVTEKPNPTAFDPAGKIIAGVCDRSVMAWSTQDGRVLWSRKLQAPAIVVFSPSGRSLAVMDVDIPILDAATGSIQKIIKPGYLHAWNGQWLSESWFMHISAVGHGNSIGKLDALDVWNVATGERLCDPFRMDAEMHRISQVAIDRDAKLVAVAMENGVIRLLTIQQLLSGAKTEFPSFRVLSEKELWRRAEIACGPDVPKQSMGMIVAFAKATLLERLLLLSGEQLSEPEYYDLLRYLVRNEFSEGGLFQPLAEAFATQLSDGAYRDFTTKLLILTEFLAKYKEWVEFIAKNPAEVQFQGAAVLASQVAELRVEGMFPELRRLRREGPAEQNSLAELAKMRATHFVEHGGGPVEWKSILDLLGPLRNPNHPNGSKPPPASGGGKPGGGTTSPSTPGGNNVISVEVVFEFADESRARNRDFRYRAPSATIGRGDFQNARTDENGIGTIRMPANTPKGTVEVFFTGKEYRLSVTGKRHTLRVK